MLTLIQLKTDEQRKPTTHRLEADRAYVIGRNRGEIPLGDSRVSRQHAELSVQNGTWVIRDLNSSNGTWVNGQRITGLCELEEGDRLNVGRITLIVGHLATSDPLAPPSPASVIPSADSPQDYADVSGVKPTELINVDLDAAADLDFEIDLEPIDASVIEDKDALEPSLPEAIDEPAEALSEDADSSDRAPADPPEDEQVETPPTLPEPELPHDPIVQTVDEPEVDEYAASVDFVTPTTRPESPLDDSSLEDAAAPDDLVPEAEPASSEADDAPPVVGLSLDHPKPDEEPTAPTPDISDTAPDTAPEQHQPEPESEPQPADSTSQPSKSPPPAPPTVSETKPPPPPDWAEPEDQQEIDDAGSRRSSSRGKLLAVVVLLALAGGGAFWVLTSGENNTPTNLASSSTSTSTPNAPLPPNSSPTPETPPQPTPPDRSAQAENPSPPSPAEIVPVNPVETQPQRGVEPSPPLVAETTEPPTTSPNLVEQTNLEEERRSDPFGEAPTLTAVIPTPRPAPPAQAVASASQPDPTPALTVTPGSTPTPADETDASTASPGLTLSIDEPLAVIPPEQEQKPTVVEEPTAAVPSASDSSPPSTGPAVALSDPAPALPVTPPADRNPLLEVPTTLKPAPPAVPTPSAPAAAARQIVYVVDASGSMVDSMNQGALTWLEEQLDALSEQDRFTVLFFRSGEVIEAPPAGLKRASDSILASLLRWVDPTTGNVQLRGQSEPLVALQQAISYQPTDIYILSDDKFGQRRAADDIDANDLDPLLDEGSALIHTVQFFYRDQNDDRLQSIAQRFGGEYEFIEEPPFDVDPAQDLGLDFLGSSR